MQPEQIARDEALRIALAAIRSSIDSLEGQASRYRKYGEGLPFDREHTRRAFTMQEQLKAAIVVLEAMLQEYDSDDQADDAGADPMGQESHGDERTYV
jgi:hypothetical protein